MDQIIEVPVPPVVEDIVQDVRITHQERFSERIFTDCPCASASDFEEMDNVVRYVDECNSEPSSNRGRAFPQIVKTFVEADESVPQECFLLGAAMKAHISARPQPRSVVVCLCEY